MKITPYSPNTETAFAEACEVSGFQRLLFISGQVPADDNQVVPPDYPSQYRLAWANVERQLKAAGMSFDKSGGGDDLSLRPRAHRAERGITSFNPRRPNTGHHDRAHRHL